MPAWSSKPGVHPSDRSQKNTLTPPDRAATSGTSWYPQTASNRRCCVAGGAPKPGLENRSPACLATILHSIQSVLELPFADGTTSGEGPEPICRVKNECTPSATYVQELFILAEVQLAADVVKFGKLRLFQGQVRLAKIGARVHHARIEKVLIELVGTIVVVANVSCGLRLGLE